MGLGCWARKRLGASVFRKGHLGRCYWSTFSAFGLNPEGTLRIGWAFVTGWLAELREEVVLAGARPQDRVYFQTGGSYWQTA